MKAFTMALTGAAMFLSVSLPAWADGGTLEKLLSATQEDYRVLKSGFQSTAREDTGSREAYKKEVRAVMRRISARRDALADLERLSIKTMPLKYQGLARMLIRDLDRINLSILALVSDGRGYSGYLRTGDEELVKGINNWQDGIRSAIAETRRCMKMAAAITGPLVLGGGLTPLPAH